MRLTDGASALLAAYNDQDFGFMRLTLDMKKKRLIGEFFAAFGESHDSGSLPQLCDSFRLDLREHLMK